ncbi:bystin-like [Limulus polyphemus]|uniref:Bystin-like n=1 Tax=Limulus polyphemus TaxID=6850 RepID=A0ABM1BDP6_LIMPO|nr:bystin-like [Limulus polyphemus]
MGKASKIRTKKVGRNIPLDTQIEKDGITKPTTRIKSRKRKDEDELFTDDKLSKKILEQARLQQEDLEEEYGTSSKKKKGKPVSTLTTVLGPSTSHTDSDSDGDESEIEENTYYEDFIVDEDEERSLQLFMSKDASTRKTLADIIKEKLTEKETEIETQFSDAGSIKLSELDDRVVEMYKGVKQVLSHYRSGKLPKAFKIIPALTNWEQVLYLTEPETWTAAAMYQATRIATEGIYRKNCQFYNLVLLPRIRDDIVEYKKLNFHLYQALRKALFKPGAFFKGIILPICESGTCTLREAVIISSVIAKNSIPMLHSAAAILKIAEMDYTGASSIFLRTLLDKKYALPYRVTDAVVYHFLRFSTDKRELPVLWHQCLLTFVQRYKEDIASEQQDALHDLLRVHTHPQITPEIRRELQNSKCCKPEMETSNSGKL